MKKHEKVNAARTYMLFRDLDTFMRNQYIEYSIYADDKTLMNGTWNRIGFIENELEFKVLHNIGINDEET
jgi:hypothetical protein